MLDKIVWDNSYVLGVDEIDSQHQHLLALINYSIGLVQKMKPAQELKESMLSIRKYTIWHFKSEEQLMELYDYPGLVNHQEEHNDLLDSLKEQLLELDEHQIAKYNQIHSFFIAWFGGHSFGYDREMCTYINLQRKGLE